MKMRPATKRFRRHVDCCYVCSALAWPMCRAGARLLQACVSCGDRAAPATILNQGYIIEIASGGPWLAQDLTVAINWDARGVWHEITDAELALARSQTQGRK